MKQLEIVGGIVLTLALAVGVVYATGGFETGELNNSTETDSVIVKDTVISRTIDNTTNATENVTVNETSEPETGIVNSITGVFKTVIQNVVKTSSSGGSSHSSSSSGGNSNSSSSPGETKTTPTAMETPCPTTDPTATPTANETVNPDETATPCPTENTTVEPTPLENTTIEPTPTEIEPTPTPTDPIPSPTSEILTGPGTAGVTRTYYHIANHDTKTTSIIVESEFPAEFADMDHYTLMDHVYEFSKVELRHIYYYYNSPNIGPNGEGLFGDYGSGYNLGSRMGRTGWIYPVAETAILIYSEDVRFYVISTVDFTQSVSINDPYTGEPGYIPCKFFGKGDDNAGIPEKQPGKPRYYDMPLAEQMRLQLEHRFPDYYLPVKPAPKPPDGVSDDAFVIIKGSGFEPKTITVPVGTIVGWKNDDDSDQTVTSTGSTRFFDSGSLNPRAAFTYLFSDPGEYTYISQTSGFTGTVIVIGDDSPTPTEPTPEPTVTVEPTPEPTTSEPTPEPTPTESLVTSEETPIVEPELEKISTFTPEPTEEPIEEQTPVEDENETN